jgi:hypothetical protein
MHRADQKAPKPKNESPLPLPEKVRIQDSYVEVSACRYLPKRHVGL